MRRLHAGVVLAVLYAVVALSSRGAGRPLFDGFAPPPPYNWVKPPPEFAAGNRVPKPSSFEVALGPGGSVVSGGTSQDGQVIFSLPAGAFAPNPPDTQVKVAITPIDPATLALPPPGLAPAGNAYRIDFSYQPSDRPVPALVVPSDVFFVVPEPAQTLLFSSDGRTWENVPSRPVADPTQAGGAITGPGFYLAAAPPVARAGDSASDRNAGGLARVAAVTAVLALVLALAPVAWRRGRGREAR